MDIKDVHLSSGSHVVILGAGASIASALRNPEKHGLSLPSMNDLPKVCGLDEVLSKFPEKLICDNFEATYSNLVEHNPNNYYLKKMNKMIYSYFRNLEERLNMLSTDMEDIKKIQTKLLEMKTTMPEMKNTLGGINNRSVIIEKRISELEDVGIEIPQNETQRDKDWGRSGVRTDHE